MATSDVVRVKLWCVPRSTSTDILKCMTYVPNLQVWFEPYQMGYLYSKFGKNRKAITNMASELWKIAINDQNSHLDGISGKFCFVLFLLKMLQNITILIIEAIYNVQYTNQKFLGLDGLESGIPCWHYQVEVLFFFYFGRKHYRNNFG